MKTKNISFRGGASAGLGYFRIWKEIFNKNIKFNVFAGTSAGAVIGVPIMAGLSPEKGMEILKRIRGDKYLGYDKEIQKAKWYRKPFMFIWYLIVLRTAFFYSCKRILKEYFPKWEDVNKRCKKSFIAFVLQKDVIRTLGKECIKDIKTLGLEGFLNSDKFNEIPEFYISSIPVFYASDDGIYKYDKFYERIEKVSNDVMPPWKAVLASFNNPLLPANRLGIDRVFDGGIIDNFAIMPQSGDYISVSCASKPKKKLNGLKNVSDYLFLENNPEMFCECKPLKEKGFFEFTDKEIEKEFKRDATNYFKE
jgi:predicted acylesterase/phospholipase RssA